MQEAEGKPDKGKMHLSSNAFPCPLLSILMASFLPKLIEALLSISSSSLASLERTPLCFTVESVFIGYLCMFMCVHVCED